MSDETDETNTAAEGAENTEAKSDTASDEASA